MTTNTAIAPKEARILKFLSVRARRSTLTKLVEPPVKMASPGRNVGPGIAPTPTTLEGRKFIRRRSPDESPSEILFEITNEGLEALDQYERAFGKVSMVG